MKKEDYCKILEDNVKQSAANLDLGQQWIFQQDNNPKHTSKKAKKWFQDKDVDMLDLPSQSPDLNPTENSWRDLKQKVRERQPSNLKDLEKFVKEEWSKLSVSTCGKICQELQTLSRSCDKKQRPCH